MTPKKIENLNKMDIPWSKRKIRFLLCGKLILKLNRTIMRKHANAIIFWDSEEELLEFRTSEMSNIALWTRLDTGVVSGNAHSDKNHPAL